MPLKPFDVYWTLGENTEQLGQVKASNLDHALMVAKQRFPGTAGELWVDLVDLRLEPADVARMAV